MYHEWCGFDHGVRGGVALGPPVSASRVIFGVLCFRGRMFSLDFGAMRVCDLAFDRVRRLTTPTGPLPVLGANAGANPSCHTVWKYYCRDNFGWREYSEVSSHTHTHTH